MYKFIASLSSSSSGDALSSEDDTSGRAEEYFFVHICAHTLGETSLLETHSNSVAVRVGRGAPKDRQNRKRREAGSWPILRSERTRESNRLTVDADVCTAFHFLGGNSGSCLVLAQVVSIV